MTAVLNLSPAPIQAPAVNGGGYFTTPTLQWLTQSLIPRVANSLQTITLTGDVTGSGGVIFSTTIAPGAVTLGKMAPLAATSFLGNNSASAAMPQALTPAQAVAMLPAGGDLAGTYDAPTVTGLRGKTIPALAAGYLHFNGTSWTYDTTLNGTAYQVAGVQVLGAQVTGMGATLGVYTLSGTYATDLPKLQALYNQMIVLVAALKAHGMVAT